MAIEQSTFDAMLFENLKVTVGAVNGSIIQSQQNAVANQQQMNSIAQVLVGRVADTLLTTDVPEGLGLAAAQRGDLAKQIADLSAAVSSMMGTIKAGGNVPPVTP